MQASIGSLFKFAFGISPLEASFARRGFWFGDSAVRKHLEYIGASFLKGYNSALEDRGGDALTTALEEVEDEFRGFAYEGAAMALALLDQLIPWKRNRLQSFMEGPGSPHIFMMYVGAGWSLARLRLRQEMAIAEPHPLLRWLAMDGYGFHEGYFHGARYVREQKMPTRLKGYARRVFDQGLGRSLWFSEGADVRRIASTIDKFSAWRRADLWSGVGLACAYAGGVGASAISELRHSAVLYAAHVAQGVAFAAKTRQRAGNSVAHTEMACNILCGLSADEAARITDVELTGLVAEAGVPAYEVWRERIRAHFSREVVQV
jgi:enediyne biosynthesis protein E3